MADPVVVLTNGVPTSGNGAITTLGQVNTDPAVITDVNGTFQQYLRGLVKLFTTATFKAASTAPVATDPALVVALSPNSVNANGRASAANGSAPVVLSTEDFALLGRLLPTATASGATPSRINAAASTNATNLKATAGQLYTIDVFNAAAYIVFLKLYNKASAPTVGTDVPVMTIPIQAGGGYSKTWPMGLPFSTGIAYAITKLQADTDTTVVVAGDLTGNTTWI